MNPPYDELLRRMRAYRDNALSFYPVNYSVPTTGKQARIMVRLCGGAEEKLADFGDWYDAYIVADLLNELLKLKDDGRGMTGRLRQ